MNLFKRRILSYLIIKIILTTNIFFIFYYLIENVFAENITHSEYNSTLTIGTIDINSLYSSYSSSNNSLIKTILDNKNNTDRYITQKTTINDKLVYLMHFNFLQNYIDYYPHLSHLLYHFS